MSKTQKDIERNKWRGFSNLLIGFLCKHLLQPRRWKIVLLPNVASMPPNLLLAVPPAKRTYKKFLLAMSRFWNEVKKGMARKNKKISERPLDQPISFHTEHYERSVIDRIHYWLLQLSHWLPLDVCTRAHSKSRLESSGFMAFFDTEDSIQCL